MLEAPGKILVMRLSSLGDLVLMVPMLRSLRAAHPDHEIHLLCKEKYAGLFEGNTFIDRMFLVRRGDLRELASIRSQLTHERYDAIVDAHNVIRSNLLYRTVRARKKIQIRKDELKKLLLIRGKTNLYTSVISQLERYGEIARKLGIRMNADDGELPVPEAAAASAESALSPLRRADKPLVAFAPGARWPTKKWPKEYFGRLAAEVARSGHGVVLIGGMEDAAMNAEIAGETSSPSLDLTGKLTIIESAAVLKKCGALVTNDSAPLHLAEAVGTSVVAFFGPTVREFGYFPRLERSVPLEIALPCRPCSRNGARPCPYGTMECLAAIVPETALRALMKVLDKKQVDR